MTTTILPGEKGSLQYSNLRFLKRGGMGSIYLATDTFSGDDVAVKVIQVEDDAQKKILEAEFKIAVNLAHPNIVKTFYYGEFSELSGCYFYCIMEMVTAGNLRKLLEAKVSFLPIQQCL